MIFAFALISNTIVSASQRIVTGMDCEVVNSRVKPWGATWYGPLSGAQGGSTTGFAGRLFEFDCQRNCFDSDSDRGHYWVTCGYSYKDVEDLQDFEQVMVEVKTEAFNRGWGSCGNDWTRAMSLDSTGWSAMDTQGDRGHYGFHICYKLEHWENVKSSGVQVITDLMASTQSSVSGYTQIGQWDTENRGTALAYGNLHHTKDWLHLYMTKATPEIPSFAKVIGQWNYETVNRPLNSDIDYTVTKHFESSESSETTESDMKNWGHQISESQNVEVAVQASAKYGQYSAGIESRYGYTYNHERSETFQRYLQNIAFKTFSQSLTVEHKYKIPQRVEGEPIYVNIWYFKTDVINDDLQSGTHYALSGGIETHGCGYSIPPNCLPGFCQPHDPHCWYCTSAAAIIDPDFVPPPECVDHGEGCDWYPVTSSECPSSEISAALPGCNEAMENGELCEADSSLPNGVSHNINNCGNYDVFRFMCD